MNFDWTDEQRQLKDSVARMLGDTAGFEQQRHATAQEPGFSEAVWAHLVELGITALAVPEAFGGFGGGAVDLFAVLEETGKALSTVPLLSSCVLATSALKASGDSQLRSELLAGLADGSMRAAWAHDEPAARHAALWVETGARQHGDDWRIDGTKGHVMHAATADRIIVSARIAGEPDDAAGIGLFVVSRDDPGLTLSAHRLLDETPAATLHLKGVRATLLTPGDDPLKAFEALQATIHAGIAASCADALGAMQTAYDLTVEHVKTRRQFGRPLADNQAVRHQVAEMQVALETSRSMVMLAAMALDDPAVDAALELSRAKLYIGRFGRSLCHTAVQLHGGIGITEEYPVGHCLRRLVVFDSLFGDSEAHANRLATSIRTSAETT